MTAKNTEISNNELLEKLLAAIKEEGNNNKEELKNEIRIENEKLLNKIEEQATRIKKLETKCDSLEEQTLQFERTHRKNNIIIFGLQTPDENLLNYTINKFNELLGIDVSDFEINNLYVLKANQGIKVEFVSYLKKVTVLKICSKLKGTGISVVEDLCFRDRQDRKILIEHLKLAKTRKLYAKIIGNKLRVNDEVYTVDQLKSMNCNRTITQEESQSTSSTSKSTSAPASPLVGQPIVSTNILKQPNVSESQNSLIEPNNQLGNDPEKKRKLAESPEKPQDIKAKKTSSLNTIRSSSRNRNQPK